MIQSWGRQIAANIVYDGSCGSDSWLHNFKTRHGFVSRAATATIGRVAADKAVSIENSRAIMVGQFAQVRRTD